MDTENLLNMERIVLSAIFFTPNVYDDIASIIQPEDFLYPIHKGVFDIISKLHKKDLPISIEMVLQQVPKGMNISQSDISQIISMNPVANIEVYAQEIKDASIKRRLNLLANTLREKSLNNTESSAEILESIEHEVYELSTQNIKSDFKDSEYMVDKTLEFLMKIKSNNQGGIIGAATGFHELDKFTTGLNKGDLIIIGARPSMGKTSFVLNIAQNMLNQGKGVAFFSLEMSDVQLTFRMFSAASGIHLQTLRTGNMTDKEYEDLIKASEDLKRREFFVDDGAMLNINMLRTKLRKLKTKHPNVEVAVIDYLGLMKGAEQTTGANRQNEISDISRGLKMLARELNMPIIVLSQLNRYVESRDDKRPILSDLRDSGAIEQDADIIIFIYRDDVYLRRADKEREARLKKEGKEKEFKPEYKYQELEPTELIVAKNRNGEIGTAKIVFNSKLTRFENPKHPSGQEYTPTKMLEEIMNMPSI